MKKTYIISAIIIVVIVGGIFAGYKVYNSKGNTNISDITVQSDNKLTTVNVKTTENKNQNIIKVTGFEYINNYVLNDILKMNGINGVELDIDVHNNEYIGVEASQILNACEKTLNITIPKNNIQLANILLASSTGLDRFETKENVSEIVEKTNSYFKNNYSSNGLYMGTPNKILNTYSTSIKNNDGANSLFVQMCIFLNEYYANNSNNSNN